jgi:hypothetical protein
MPTDSERVEAVARAIFFARRNRQRVALGYEPLSGSEDIPVEGVNWAEALEAARPASLSSIPAQQEEVTPEAGAAMREALNLARALHRRWYSHVPQWEPLDTVAGIISQIDNMTAGLGERLDAAEVELAAMRSAALRGKG